MLMRSLAFGNWTYLAGTPSRDRITHFQGQLAWIMPDQSPSSYGSLRFIRREDAGEFQPRAGLAFEELVLGLRGLAQAVDLDEAQRRRHVVLVAFLVGGQLVTVEAALALAADRHDVALVHL